MWIDGDELIESLKARVYRIKNGMLENDSDARIAIKILEQTIDEIEGMHDIWTSVEEELPNENEPVYILDDEGLPWVAKYDSDYGWRSDECGEYEFDDDEVKAWMYIPKYEKRGEQE